MKSLNAYQLSGLLLIAGIVLAALSGILSPGVLLIDMLLVTEAQDLYDRLDVKVDNAEITHVTASVYILGHILLMGGVSALWMGLRGGSAGDALMRMGILALGVAFVCGIASAILDHIMVHIVLHGNTAGLSEAEYQPLALGVNVTDMAVEMMLLITTFIGHALLAVGLATKFAPGLRKWSAIAVSLISLAALVGGCHRLPRAWPGNPRGDQRAGPRPYDRVADSPRRMALQRGPGARGRPGGRLGSPSRSAAVGTGVGGAIPGRAACPVCTSAAACAR